MGGVFANGLEISGKAVSAKTIAAFPDVCMTPPENPATPPGIPVPYPNFAMAGDTEKGTGKVKIKDKTVNLKNKSDMSKTSGDEAGAAAKKGVVSSKNTGKSYFNSWSNDVKFEGESVVRMSDLTTNNHASPVGNTPPMIHVAALNLASGDCDAFNSEWMAVYKAGQCPKGYQAHHIVDNCSFARRGSPGTGEPSWRSMPENRFQAAAVAGAAALGRGWKTLRNQFLGASTHPAVGYDDSEAPCICLEDGQSEGAGHRMAHDSSRAEAATRATNGIWTYKDAREAGVQSMMDLGTFDDHQLMCISLALKAYYEDNLGCTETTELVAPPGSTPSGPLKTGRGNATASQSSAPTLL